MKTLLALASACVIGIVSVFNHMAASRLEAELQGLRKENSELPAVRREKERLQRVHAEATRRAAEGGATQSSAQARAESRTSAASTLVVGEWRAPGSWQKSGRSTPIATIETALWAAAGGDLAALQKLLHLDEAARVKAEALWARLPETARANYTSSEQLLAAFATKSLPLGEAQLVWHHQPDEDEAFACLIVKNPYYVPTSLPVSAPLPLPTSREAVIAQAAAMRESRAKEKRPPVAPTNEASRALYVSLRRTDAGWSLAVSPGSVDRIEQELRGGN